MSRSTFHRDFNLCKALLLAGLIGAAMLIGDLPGHDRDKSAAASHVESVMPASYHDKDAARDVPGIEL